MDEHRHTREKPKGDEVFMHGDALRIYKGVRLILIPNTDRLQQVEDNVRC